MLDRPSDSDMVRKAIEHYLPNIWRYALAISGDSDKADDLTQATCLRAIEKSHQFRSGQKPVGWFITICRSVWLNQLRSDKVRAEASMDRSLAPDLIDRSSDTEMTVMAHKVFAKVMELPDAQRETVTLVYVEGFTYREAAEILNVPVGTVMSRLAVARKKLWWLAASAFDDDRNVVSR